MLLINSSDEELQVKKGERVVQLIVEKIEEVEILQTESLEQTVRGAEGFGSMGIARAEIKGKKKKSPRTKLEIIIGLKTTNMGEGDSVKALIDSGATGMFIDKDYI